MPIAPDRQPLQGFRVPQSEEAIDGAAVSTPRGEMLNVRLRRVLANAKVRAERSAVAAEWTTALRPHAERAALEYLEFVSSVNEARDYVPALAHDTALVQLLSRHYSPIKVTQRIAQSIDKEAWQAADLAPLSQADALAVWALFRQSVRGLLQETGWRRTPEWRLLSELHQETMRRGRHRAAKLVMLAD